MAFQDAPPELAEEDVVGGLVLRVVLEAGSLEVLHRVGLAVFQRLDEFLADRVAELGQPAVAVQ